MHGASVQYTRLGLDEAGVQEAVVIRDCDVPQHNHPVKI